MTKRSRTILTVSIKFPVPVEMNQTETFDALKNLVESYPSKLPMTEAIIKLEKKEIIYL